MPSCTRADGLHKKGYPDRATARKAARYAQKNIGRVRPYRCPDCGEYHVGHPKADKR